MNLTRRSLFSLAGIAAASVSACSRSRSGRDPSAGEASPDETPEEPSIDLHEFDDLLIDADAWQYDEDGDCYYQLGLPYCLRPGAERYESLSIFVPGAYFVGKRKGSAYSCSIAEDAQVGEFTPQTAPVALPVNSLDCGAQECPTSFSYEGLETYLAAGFVYVYAGFRGRSGGYESTTEEYFSGGAPWPVVDCKAAVRCLRLNAAALPCDTARVFMFGQGVGGGICALMGVSGDAQPYEDYLQEIGAATHDAEGSDLSDDVFGIAAWCPTCSLASADAAYEWMMGQYATDGTRAEGTWTRLLSGDLASLYGDHVNGLGLVDAKGDPLTLDRIEDGSYADGSYYDGLVAMVGEAAGDFLRHTDFPYAAMPPVSRARFFPGNPDGVASSEAAEAESQEGEASASEVAGVRQVQATVYDTVESYVISLNGDNRWLTYNASRGEADVTGLWGFVSTCRPPAKDVCAYDRIDRSGPANQVFGTDELPSVHFDSMVSGLLGEQRERYAEAEGWNEDLVAEWRGDLAERDALDRTVSERVGMSDSLSYLVGGDEGPQGVVAPHWRVHTGLFQSETTLVGEVNLATALASREDVSDVAFEAVWESGFGLAERQGDPEDNLVAWMLSCCTDEEEKENQQKYAI